MIPITRPLISRHNGKSEHQDRSIHMDFSNDKNTSKERIPSKQVKLLKEDKLCVILTNSIMFSSHQPGNNTDTQPLMSQTLP
jgi:hypothetical protein